MAEIQQPDVVGNYLSNYYAAQQRQQAQADRERQMQRQDSQDQMAQEEHDWIGMQRKNEMVARVAMAADTPEKWQQLVPQAAQQLGWTGPMPGFDQRERILSESMSVADQIKQKIEERNFKLQEGVAKANMAQSYAAAEASRASAEKARAGGGGYGTGGHPLPSRLQTAEDEDIGSIQTVQSINAQLDGIASQIDTGELELGPVNNLISRGQNMIGASNEGSTNFATMMSTLEKMCNESLILNKGVQTEGDAVRAWNALIANVNDPRVVKAQIARIKSLNDRAAAQKVQLINIRRARNGTEPFDPAQLALPTAPQTAPAQPRSAPQQQGGEIHWDFDANGNLVPRK